MIYLPGQPWEPFYEGLTAVAVAATPRYLSLPVLLPGEEMFILRAAYRTSANTVNPIAVGVFQYERFFRMAETLAPVAETLYPVSLDILLSEGMSFRGYYGSPAGAEVIELYIHGLRRKLTK